MLQVFDLGAAIYGDRRREALIEELPLIVAHDNDGFRSGLPEFPAEHFHCPVALRESLTPRLNRNFGGESGGPLPQQGFIIVRLSAIPVFFVFAIRLSAKIPLLWRGRKQRAVRRSNTQNDIRHKVQS